MRRAILLLPLALSPVYAIGFWGSLGGGLNFGGFGEMRRKDTATFGDWDTLITFKIGASAKDFIFGGNLMGGVSLEPIPIAVGLGVDYYAGTQKYEFDFWSMVFEDTLEVKRTYIKLPVAYQLSLPMLKSYFGFYPAYALYSVKGMMEDTTRIDFKGLAFGFFTNLYYSIGPLGIGGGIFFDYGPRFKGRSKPDNTDVYINNVFHYGINLGLLVSLGVLE
jgi:hypothetical protein